MNSRRQIDFGFSHDYGFYGSKEHYCHLLWGFALPGLYDAIKATEGSGRSYQFVIEDCGPMMNPVLQYLFGLLKGEVTIVPREKLSATAIFVPRWDIMAHYPSVVGQDDYTDNHFVRRFSHSARLQKTVSASGFAASFAASIRFTRNWILDQIEQDSDVAVKGGNKYLVLDRSDEPEYFSQAGPAEVKGYGKTRRLLKDIDHAVHLLREKGHALAVYEPGAHTVANQIQTFNRCDGVIGIKGAEFANLAWMPDGSRMIMITPDKMKTPPIYQRLGKMLGLKYLEISGGPSFSPSLLDSVGVVEDYLNDPDRG